LLVLALIGADVVGAVAEIIDVVVQELIRSAVGGRSRWARLTYFTGRSTLARLLLTSRAGRTFA
jgi:hypothetical protein